MFRVSVRAIAARIPKFGFASIPVQHDHQNHQFVAVVDGHRAELNYKLDKNTIDIKQTLVPSGLRGKGVAGVLADAAFEYCRANNMLVKPTCSYISDTYIPKNPEKTKGLVVLS